MELFECESEKLKFFAAYRCLLGVAGLEGKGKES